MVSGCTVPQRVYDDIAMLKLEEQALYNFNLAFLQRAKSTTNEELQKKLKMVMISKVAHQRAEQGLDLLGEYVGASEVISNAQLAATEDTIKQIADKVVEKLKEE